MIPHFDLKTSFGKTILSMLREVILDDVDKNNID